MSMGTAGPDNATLATWWGQGNWDALAPALRAVSLSTVPRTFRFDGDVCDDIAATMLARAYVQPTVPKLPAAWVGVATRRLALDHWRSKGCYTRRPTAKALRVNGLADEHERHQPLDRMIRVEDLARLRMALHHLPDAMRRPLVLSGLHGRTMADLAAQMGTTEGAMKMRVQRARAQLAKLFHAMPGVAYVHLVPPNVAPPKRQRAAQLLRHTRAQHPYSRSSLMLAAPDMACTIDGSMPSEHRPRGGRAPYAVA